MPRKPVNRCITCSVGYRRHPPDVGIPGVRGRNSPPGHGRERSGRGLEAIDLSPTEETEMKGMKKGTYTKGKKSHKGKGSKKGY